MGQDGQRDDALEWLYGTIADEAPEWMRCDDAELIGCVPSWTTCQACPRSSAGRAPDL